MTRYDMSPSPWQRLARWLAEPAPGTVAGRRLALHRAEQARRDAAARAAAARAAARVAAVRARYADDARHAMCERVQASGRCVPRDERPDAMPADMPAPVGAQVPDRVPDYLVELVRHADGTWGRPA